MTFLFLLLFSTPLLLVSPELLSNIYICRPSWMSFRIVLSANKKQNKTKKSNRREREREICVLSHESVISVWG